MMNDELARRVDEIIRHHDKLRCRSLAPVGKVDYDRAVRLIKDLYVALQESEESRPNLSGANLIRANLRRANLKRANLRGADLSEADLSEANLSEANLSGADLSGADFRWAIGNGKELKTVQSGKYNITYSADDMAIGCEQHTIKQWWNFSNTQIARMDIGALEWWAEWKPILQAMMKEGSDESI